MNPTVTATFNTTSSGGTCAIGQYRAKYFNNISLSGAPVFEGCETAIAYDWGATGPGHGLAPDNFSVRWTGQFAFSAGSYVFTARGDDGIRVWVDGASPIINAWQDQAATTSQATVSLATGTHEVKVEYYEHGGSAVAQVGWTAGAGGGACPIGQYRAEYFNNISLSGTPVFQRCETAIAYDWGAAGPGNGVGSDNFSVRWTGQFAFAAGSHVFTARGDDGFRISVDGAHHQRLAGPGGHDARRPCSYRRHP